MTSLVHRPSSPILVVEDDRDIREVIVALLEEEGFSVVGAANGAIALEYLRSTSPLPSFILLDLMMPIMNGHQFRAELLKVSDWASIPVAVITADGRSDEKMASMDAVGYIRKPLELEALIALVERFARATR